MILLCVILVLYCCCFENLYQQVVIGTDLHFVTIHLRGLLQSKRLCPLNLVPAQSVEVNSSSVSLCFQFTKLHDLMV